MADVTGTIGSEQVELKNASTEETLVKVLASLKTLNQSILKTSSGGAAVTKSVDSVLDAVSKVSPHAAAINAAFTALGSVIGGLVNKVSVVAGAFIGLAEQAMDNQAKMSDFYGALGVVAGQIPILGGVLGGIIGLFQKMAAMQEANLAQYQKLTTAGINFGGSLTTLRMAASNAYMSFEKFSDLMVKNSTTFARMGGNVNDGAEAFAKMSNELLKSPVGDRLLALGYTTDDVNQGLADYINLTGGRNAQEMKNTKAIINSSAAYMEQLDGLAQMTGKNRAEMAEDMKKKAQMAAWQAKLATMTDEERNKATLGMANAMATGGEGAVDAFQAQVMGIAVQTKAGQMYTGLYSEAAEAVRQSADMVYNSNMKDADMTEKMFDAKDAQMRDGAKLGDQTQFALQQLGGAAGSTLQAVESSNNQYKQAGRAASEEATRRKNLANTEAAEMAKANKSMQEFGQQIMGFLTPIIREMTPYMADVLNQFKIWMSTVNLPKIGEQLGEAMKKVMEYIKNFFTDDGQEKIINDIKYLFGLIAIEIKRSLMPLFYSAEDAKKDKEKLDADKAVYDASASAAKNQLGSIAAQKELNDLVAAKAIDESARKLAQAEITKNANAESAALTAANAAKSKLIAQKKAEDEDIPISGLGGAAAGAASLATAGATLGLIGGPLVALGAGIVGGVIGGIAGGLGMIDYGINTPTNKEGYDTGTLGKTGKLFKDFGKGTQVTLHGSEAVTTPDQIADLVSKVVSATQSAGSSDTNNLVGEIQRLNTLTAEMLRHIKDTAENTKRTVDATKSLSGNLF